METATGKEVKAVPFVIDTEVSDKSQCGIWREYRPGMRAKLVPLDKQLMRELRKDATVEVPHERRGFRKSVKKKLDDDLFDKLAFRAVIEDWEGFVDRQKQTLPPTDGNIDLVCGKLLDFSAWVLEEALYLGEMDAEERDELLKNSKASPDGSETGPKE